MCSVPTTDAIAQARLAVRRERRELTDEKQAFEAFRDRTADLEHLTTEVDALERAKADLEAVIDELESLLDQPLDVLEFNVLRLTRARLDGLKETCDEVARTRQEELRRRQRVTIADVDDLGELLYEDEPGLYPVLATIAAVGEAIDQAKRRIDRRLLEVR
ncbi:DUF7260 family protein [Natrialbaceae archaeon A-gly3]